MVLARVKTELLAKIELLVDVLHHEIERVLLSDRMQLERVEIIAIYECFKLDNIFVRAMILFKAHVLAIIISTLLSQDGGRHYR